MCFYSLGDQYSLVRVLGVAIIFTEDEIDLAEARCNALHGSKSVQPEDEEQGDSLHANESVQWSITHEEDNSVENLQSVRDTSASSAVLDKAIVDFKVTQNAAVVEEKQPKAAHETRLKAGDEAVGKQKHHLWQK